MQKSKENLKTLQLAAEWHSINKNQRFIKIKLVVPEKNAKSEENFETLQLAVECHSIKQKSKIYQDQTNSSWEKCKKWRKFWNFTIDCRVP